MQHFSSSALRRFAVAGPVLAAILAMLTGCPTPDSTPLPNSLPDTRLANVPNNDTIGVNIDQGVIPEQTLYWVGDDPDGYVVGYRYRWIDLRRGVTDSTRWVTLVNLTNIAGSPLDTFIVVYPSAPSVYRIYNFLATIRSTDLTTINSIQDRLATGRYFAVPYTSGPIEGDSIRGADPVQVEAPNKGTFIFNSPADSNQHRFEVKAIDNSDSEDPTPATVYFWTRRSPGPIVFVASGPSLARPEFVLRCPTQRNLGLTFTFGGFDASTNEREYSWTVDDSTINWSPWSSNPRAVVTAGNLLPMPTDTHYVYVRGRNRWGVISAVAFRPFRAIIPAIDDPAYPRKILFLNNTRNTVYPSLPTGEIPTDTLNNFYTSILDSLGFAGRYEVWSRRTGSSFTFPSRTKLAEFGLVIVAAENRILPPLAGAGWVFEGDKVAALTEYLNIGGNLIWSGTPDIKKIIASSAFNTFTSYVFHMSSGVNPLTPFIEEPGPNFIGATGRAGYPNITLDPVKTPPDSIGLRYISVHWPEGFGEPILTWRHATGSFLFQGNPLGIRYESPDATPGPYCRRTFSVVFFGFPLYYAERSQAIAALRQAIADVHFEP